MNQLLTFLILLTTCTIVRGQTADFTYESPTGTYCAPATIRFTKITTGEPIGYVWTFGNNSGSNLENPTIVFPTAGSYVVRLIAIYRRHTVEISKTIVVHPAISGNFEVDRDKLCMPGVVNFMANETVNISRYEWDFNDGITTSTSPTINHTFPDYTVYNVSLKTFSQTGCSGQSFKTVTVERPVIDASTSQLTGCIPAAINFNASVSVPPGASVTNYNWSFGNGQQQNTTNAFADNNYTQTGNFSPKLRVTTNEGCSNVFDFPTLAFGIPPTNHVAYPKKTVFCGSEAPEFVAKAVNANKYFWDFGEGDTTSVYDTVTTHKFRTLGIKTITVTPLFNDCPGTPISFDVEVIGVIAGFTFKNTCLNMKRFNFNNTSQGNQSYRLWTFGDGSPDLQTLDVVHSYPDTGTFETALQITDSITGCSDVYSRFIYTAIPSLVNADSSICRNSQTTFAIPGTYNNPDIIYNWNVVGLQETSNQQPHSVYANVLGHFNNDFVVIDNGIEYCKDTVRLNANLLVRGPQLSFTAENEICVSKPWNIVNNSTPFVPTDVITKWEWLYGITNQRDSVFQPAPHYFPYWGPFDVKLTAVDIQGCSDTLVKQVTVYNIPFLRTIPDVDTVCAGNSVRLIAFHNDPILWQPASSISCATCDTIIARPYQTTNYYVTATNRFNCSVTDSVLIKVYEPFTAVAAKPDYSICAKESIQLDISPKDKIITWEPNEGLSNLGFTPTVTPTRTTTYIATLRDSAGCFSSVANIDVVVKSVPTVNAGPDKIVPYNSLYSFTPAYSSNVANYNWSPATQLNCSDCPSPSGIAAVSQKYTLTVTSDSGCVAKDVVSIVVECKGANLLLPSAFTPNRDGNNDYYYPITRGIKRIIRFAIFSREGLLMFESRNVSPNQRSYGWDGRYRGMHQPPSAYVYLLEVECDAGQTIQSKGSFVLLR